MRFILFSAMAFILFFQQHSVAAIRCSQSHLELLKKIDLSAAIKQLDMAVKKDPVGVTAEVLEKINDQEAAPRNETVQARILVLKTIHDNPENLELARLLLENFENLSEFPSRWGLDPERLDRGEEMVYVGMARADVGKVVKQLFGLTILRLAKAHPFLIMNDSRIIPVLTERMFSHDDLEDGSLLSPRLPLKREYMRARKAILVAVDYEINELLDGKSFRLLSLGEDAKLQWKEQLEMVSGRLGVNRDYLKAFARELGVQIALQRPFYHDGTM